jgi:hypothetical protein
VEIRKEQMRLQILPKKASFEISATVGGCGVPVRSALAWKHGKIVSYYSIIRDEPQQKLTKSCRRRMRTIGIRKVMGNSSKQGFFPARGCKPFQPCSAKQPEIASAREWEPTKGAMRSFNRNASGFIVIWAFPAYQFCGIGMCRPRPHLAAKTWTWLRVQFKVVLLYVWSFASMYCSRNCSTYQHLIIYSLKVRTPFIIEQT